MPDGLTDDFPLTEDIELQYKTLRQDGKSRQAAIDCILQDYATELSDSDDGPQIWIGIAKAMGKKQELTPEILSRAEKAFHDLSGAFPETQKLLTKYARRVCDPVRLGSEARYIKRKAFDPGWQRGDTFLYRLQTKEAQSADMLNWVVILRKAEDFRDYYHHHTHLFYLSICPPDAIPGNDEELNQLGYLPFQPGYTKDTIKYYHFLWSIYPSGQKQLQKYDLEYLGRFPEIEPPSCEAERNEICPGNPLFPSDTKGISSLDFYGIYCYKRYGLIK